MDRTGSSDLRVDAPPGASATRQLGVKTQVQLVLLIRSFQQRVDVG